MPTLLVQGFVLALGASDRPSVLPAQMHSSCIGFLNTVMLLCQKVFQRHFGGEENPVLHRKAAVNLIKMEIAWLMWRNIVIGREELEQLCTFSLL